MTREAWELLEINERARSQKRRDEFAQWWREWHAQAERNKLSLLNMGATFANTAYERRTE